MENGTDLSFLSNKKNIEVLKIFPKKKKKEVKTPFLTEHVV